MSARLLLRLNVAALAIWLALGVPTVVWWRDSVFWVAFMSLYAIWISHATAVMAARAECAAENITTESEQE